MADGDNKILMASRPWVTTKLDGDGNNYVHKDTAETLTGNKTFSGTATFSGTVVVPAVTDASADTAPATVKYVKDKVTSLFSYKGSVSTVDDLPESGNIKGDVWNVSSTGANYAWSGSQWDNLSENSAYALDNAVVKLTGAQTIAGAKTFSDAAALNGGATVPTGKTLTITDAPTQNTDAANKKYVDDAVSPLATDALVAHLAGAETFTGAKTFSAGAVIPTGTALTVTDAPVNNTDAANKKYVDDSLTDLASDTRLVHTTGDESIAGDKTFTDEVVLSGGASVPTNKVLTITDAPSSNTDAANKKYVDDTVAGSTVVHTTGTETVGGVKTFSDGIVIPTGKDITLTDAPSSNTDAANKKYVDDTVAGSTVVHTTGTETVGGVKTFSDGIVIPTGKDITLTDAPTANTDAANKKYVDDTVAGSTVVHTSGTETIGGAKTFSDAATFSSAVSLNGGATVPTGKVLTLTDAPSANTDAANKKYVDDSVAPLATDASVVHLAGAETITGAKTFSAAVTLSAGATVPTGSDITLTDAPTANTDAANKKYVDDTVAGGTVVHTSGNESIAGNKTFSGSTTFTGGVTLNDGATVPTGEVITLTDAPTASTDAVNKGYVDAITAGTASFALLRLQDENGDDWLVSVDSEAETLVIEKDTASAGE